MVAGFSWHIGDVAPGTERIAGRPLDAMVGAGAPADLVEGFGLPLPIQVICDLLGVPVADRARFTGWADSLLSTSDRPLAEITADIDEMNGYLADLAATRVEHPTGDLIGSLVRERIEGDRLGEEEVSNLVRAIPIAGFETTASQLPNFVYLLLEGGDYARLVADPGLVPTAVEELLRCVPLIAQGSLTRFVLAEVELGGVLLRPGDQVLVELAAANRDAAAFSASETLDIARRANPHIAFGHGPHRCLGASLARMELQAALSALVTRMPGLRLAVPVGEVPWQAERFVRRPKELLVGW